MKALTLIATLLLLSGQAVADNGAISVTRGDLLKNRQYQSVGAINLFVDSTGNDGNACTASGTAACLTIQGALKKLPKNIRGPTLITVGSGNFAGAFIDGFNFINDISPPTSGAYLEIDGTLINYTPATGTATGTATGGTAGTTSPVVWGTLVDAAQTWTVNDLRGRIIQITGGTGSGQWEIIQSNTATTITANTVWVAPTGTSTYVISDWGTVINSGVARPKPSTFNTSLATQAGFRIGANGLSTANITLAYMRYTTANAIQDNAEGTVTFRNSRTDTTSIPIILGGGGVLNVFVNAIIIPSSQTAISWAFGSKSMSSSENLWRGATTTGNSVTTQTPGLAQFSVDSFENLANGIRFSGGFSSVSIAKFDTITGICVDANGTSNGALTPPQNNTCGIQSSSFTSCGTAIRASSSNTVYTGLGNGVISGASNTLIYDVIQGGSLMVSSGSTVAGTTEISVDGTTMTVAALRALVPKQYVDLGTLSRIVER